MKKFEIATIVGEIENHRVLHCLDNNEYAMETCGYALTTQEGSITQEQISEMDLYFSPVSIQEIEQLSSDSLREWAEMQ